MKLGTVVKVGAIVVAAASTAVGTVAIVTKASKKVGNESTAPVEKKETPVVAPTPVVEDAPVVSEIPVVEPIVEEAPVYEAPEVEEAPVEIPVVEPIVADIPVEPIAFAEPAVEEAPVEPIAFAEPAVEEAPVEPIAFAEPAVEEAPVEPIAFAEPAVEEAPVEPIAFAEPAEEVAEEVVLPTAEPIDDFASSEPILADAPVEEEALDVNPLGQGFSVSETDDPSEAMEDSLGLPSADEAFAGSDYIEEIEEPAPVEAPVYEAEPVEAEPEAIEPEVIVEEPEEAPAVEEAPEVEEAPVEETAPVFETPVEEKGKEIVIGNAVVSDKADNDNIKAVVASFDVNADNLVSFAAEGNMPMVFEFLYNDMRSDATLMSVYFVMPDGQAGLPPEEDRENVLAFGRNFIAGNEALRNFLA